MAISKTNIQAIRNVLHTDMQRRIFKQYNEQCNPETTYKNTRPTDEDYDRTQSALNNSINQVNNMRDINELLVEYCDLYTSYDNLIVATVDGTLNYVIGLLVEHCKIMDKAA